MAVEGLHKELEDNVTVGSRQVTYLIGRIHFIDSRFIVVCEVIRLLGKPLHIGLPIDILIGRRIASCRADAFVINNTYIRSTLNARIIISTGHYQLCGSNSK